MTLKDLIISKGRFFIRRLLGASLLLCLLFFGCSKSSTTVGRERTTDASVDAPASETTATDASGDAPDGETSVYDSSCRVAYQTYVSGTTNIAPPVGCGSCECNDGELTCSQSDCEPGAPIIPCSDISGGDYRSDSIEITGAKITGDTLVVSVRYPGGCERHDFALCYYDVGLAKDRFPVELFTDLIHDAHDDGCEAIVSETLRFDLSPLARAYQQAFSSKGGLVKTDIWGFYAFGEVTCEERSDIARALASDVAECGMDPYCTSDSDCVSEPMGPECAFSCDPIVVSKKGREQAVAEFKKITETICGTGCAATPIACDPTPPPVCIDGLCTRVN